jgi:hypothetical protein
MSTSVGTLQPKVHIGGPVLAAVAFVLLAAATIGVYVLTTDSQTRQSGTATSTTISGTAANTPSELSGGILGRDLGTLANTPSELRGGFIEAATAPVVRPIGRASVTPRVAQVTVSANTPSEIGRVISFTTGASILPHAKQLGLDVVAPSTTFAAGSESIAARNAMLASYQQASIGQFVAARNAMLASYQPASIGEFVAARNAMLASYQEARSDEIVVNGEVCQICWKYR